VDLAVTIFIFFILRSDLKMV